MYIPYIHTHRGDSCSDLWYHFLVIWIHCGIGTDKVGCSNLTLLCSIQYSTNKIWLLLLSELMFEFYHLSFNNLPFFFYFLRSFLLWSQLSTLKSVGLLPYKLQLLGLRRLYCSAAIFSFCLIATIFFFFLRDYSNWEKQASKFFCYQKWEIKGVGGWAQKAWARLSY